MNVAAPPLVDLASMRSPLGGDERLARLVGRGNERAFTTLYERYHGLLYRYCRSIVRNDTDAQDALQSTMTAALVALRRGQRDTPLKPWLFRIAHNESVSLLRRRRPDHELTDLHEASTVGVHERYEQRDQVSQLVADLQQLPERQRGALVMRELNDLSHEEIAIALGTSVGAAKQTIFEARRSLQEFSEGRSMSCEAIRRTISDADGRELRARRVRAHLRDCSGCAAFAQAIPGRSVAFGVIAPPLPAFAAAGVLARVLAGGSGHGGVTAVGTGAAGASAVAGAAGKTIGASLAAKALIGVAVVATAGVGATTALTTATDPAPRSSTAQPSSSAPRHGAPVGAPAVTRFTPTTSRPVGTLGAAGKLTVKPAGSLKHGLTAGSSAPAASGATHGGSGAPGLVRNPVSPGHSGSHLTGSPTSPGSAAAQHPTGPPVSNPGAAARPATPTAGKPSSAGQQAPVTPGAAQVVTPGAAAGGAVSAAAQPGRP